MPPVLDAPRLTGEKIAPEATDKAANGAEFVTLAGVRWETYENLMADTEGRASPRFTYDRGVLEIMSPLAKHEKPNRLLASFAETVMEEWEIDFVNFGSTTFKRKDQARGFEPDTCFYIQNAQTMETNDEPDLENGDPPPDLVIEVDETHSSIPRQPLLAAFGVPEIWRIAPNESVEILVLDTAAKVYHAAEQSRVLPRVMPAALGDFLARGRILRRIAWLKAVRAWARQQAELQPD